MKRILSFALALLTCLGMLLSCSKEEEAIEVETNTVTTDDGLEYDENGYLRQDYCSDADGMGIHFTNAGCAAWVDYLFTHTA